MNKDSVRIFNSIVDMFLEQGLRSASHSGDNSMAFIKLCDWDKQEFIEAAQTKARKYFADWRNRADSYTSKELEKEYGPLE